MTKKIRYLVNTIIMVCISTTSFAVEIFNKNYGPKNFSYDTELGIIFEKNRAAKNNYKIGLILDSPIFNTPIAGLLYKVFHLSNAMIQKGHSYVFFICNRNFTNNDEIDKFKINNIKVHLLEENLFYNKHYMSQLIKKEKIDILQYEVAQTFLSLGIPLKKETHLPSILILHDIEDELMDQLGKHEYRDILDYTHFVASHLADALVTLTHIDKEKRVALHGVAPDKIFVTPIGVDKSFKDIGPNLDNQIIGMLGNQLYEPNKRATIFLIDKVLPLVQLKHPDAKIKVIGLFSDDLQRLYKGRIDVIFTGAIQDINKYIKELSSFTIGTCCLETGTGMNVKVANYCAPGIPVILTPICQKGYEDITSLEIVELNPSEIANRINKLLNDKTYLKQIGYMNHKLIFKHLNWDKIADTHQQALNYAYVDQASGRKVDLKPIWMLDMLKNFQDPKLLKGHYVIDPIRP